MRKTKHIVICYILYSTCHGYGEIKCENDDENPDCGCDTAFEISCQQNRGGKNHTICVSNLYVCDGNEDCEYGEDEQGCGESLSGVSL